MATPHTRYTHTDQIADANRATGQHWFDRSTLRFFSSRIGSTVYGGKFFVTSETPDSATLRRYTVRVALPDGSVGTVSTFREYASRSGAVRRAEKLAKQYSCGEEYTGDVD